MIITAAMANQMTPRATTDQTLPGSKISEKISAISACMSFMKYTVSNDTISVWCSASVAHIICRDAGIGRQVGLKNRFPRGSEGSIPSLGTITGYV